LISKEAVIGFTLWLVAAIGVGTANGGITRQEAPERPYSRVSVASQSIRQTESNEVNVVPRPEAILQEVFFFNERSERVAKLQEFLGIKADQHYGKVTRSAHLAALEAAGMETAFIPALPNPLITDGKKRYNISDDPTHRCPQFEPLFQQYGLEPVEVFSYIAYRESRCNPKEANAKWDSKGNVTWTLNKDGSIDRGLLQINSCWKTVTKSVCGTGLEGLFDVHCNIKVAKYIMDNSAGGLANWNVWNK
jgi:hypothetical protein